jgi:hypothetical protein
MAKRNEARFEKMPPLGVELFITGKLRDVFAAERNQ